jgi:hypothetical protein
LTLEANKEFRWKGKLGINVIFDFNIVTYYNI